MDDKAPNGMSWRDFDNYCWDEFEKSVAESLWQIRLADDQSARIYGCPEWRKPCGG